MTPAAADIPQTTSEPHALTTADRLSLARQFVNRISQKLATVESQMGAKNGEKITSRLPEGEEVLLSIQLDRDVILESPLLARVVNRTLALSLRDFVGILEFPIEIDDKAEKAEGWYIREKKTFRLDMVTRSVTTDNGTFKMSQDVKSENGDIYVPYPELQQWFNFELEPDVVMLNMKLDSATPLPILERIAREKRRFNKDKLGPPVLPLLKDEPTLINYPFVDVATRTSYDRPGDGTKAESGFSASVSTAGDFMYGTLSTQSQLDKEDKLSSIRATYKRQSLEPELLGPLKARRYEIGDVYPAAIPLNVLGYDGLGTRITNADPLRNTINPSTQIRGTAFPDWDVELYRNDQLLAYSRVAEDGTYVFDDVDLFGSDNDFRVVLYGPQGEVREENISVPVDLNRLSEMGSAYDVMVAAQTMQTYNKRGLDDEDKGAPAMTAAYEVPVGKRSAMSFGLETGQESDERKFVGHTGLSTSLLGTLVNVDTAIEENGEASAQLVTRREIKRHQFRNEVTVATDKFNIEKESEEENLFDFTNNNTEEDVDIFSDRFSLNGPLPYLEQSRLRYNLGLNYAKESSGDDRMEYRAGMNGNLSRFSLNQQFQYTKSSNGEDALESLTSLGGTIGRNRLRLIAEYDLKPENQLERVTSSLSRYLSDDLELEFGLDHDLDPRLTEASAQVNWRAGFMEISPGVSYNTDHDLTATLNTRFGLGRDPQSGSINSYDRSISMNGAISAFVYLDKNGDSQFNGDDEPLKDVDLVAPQNGGHAFTDEKGHAFFNTMTPMRPTDVFISADSLEDPYWISGFEGVSVIPREGHVTSLQFPVHQSGEMDGSVYVRDEEGNSWPLRGISLSLNDQSGKKVKTVISEPDGFFLFEKIPPGQYKLTVDGKSFGTKMSRPLPQDITIGYEGTTIYGQKVYFADNSPDVPVVYLSDLSSANLDSGKIQGHDMVVDMGSYQSRLTMAVAWFKAKATAGKLLENFQLLEKPSESFPNAETGKYTLRLLPNSGNFKSVYEECKMISAKGNVCSVYILPPEVNQKMAEVSE